jgi:uncharacterized protein with NRDE domain
MAWAWRAHPRWPLVVLANRDERHARATAPLEWWNDDPKILAGRDLAAGGTWLGVTRAGRFAAITNRGGTKPPGAPSRGDLVKDFLTTSASADAASTAIEREAPRYAGFNLLLGDGDALAFASNRESRRVLEPGIHGMANGALDEAIPKVERLKEALSDWLTRADQPATAHWFALLGDATPADDDPRSAIFVHGPEYGTRSSHIVALGAERSLHFTERAFDARGAQTDTRHFEYESET